MSIFTIQFVRAVLERAIKTAAATAIAMIGTTAAFNEVRWPVIGSVVLLATILSVLGSIASAALTGGEPSLTGAEVLMTPQIALLRSGALDGEYVRTEARFVYGEESAKLARQRARGRASR